ncbi:SIS domain-containing protein [Devosia epidermidihirudinis]|nr:hypothetical protein [Devosia epidermidihirudinis]
MERVGYRAAVNRQPQSLATCLTNLASLAGDVNLEHFRKGPLALVGIGASYQVALAGAHYLRQSGILALPLYPGEFETSDLSLYGGIILLSASGESAEILDAATYAAPLPRMVLCRDAVNPLAELCDLVIAAESGADNGASSTGYTGMLLAIGLLTQALTNRGIPAEITALPETVETLLRTNGPASLRAAERLALSTSIDVVGNGVGLATAGEGVILLREAARMPAFAWDTRNYLHGPMESQDQNTGLIAIGTGREPSIATEAAAFGSAAVLLANRQQTDTATLVVPVPHMSDPIARAIVDIVAIQMVVAEMQDMAGLTDTRFRYPQSDTKRRAAS